MRRETLTALVMEANPLQCELVRMALTRHRINPIICDQPMGLRQQMAQYMPDILLIDTYLPGQNGLDLVADLMSDIRLKRTKVFFISAMGFPEIVQRAVQVGASGFFVKPLHPDLLANRILKYFSRPDNC